MKRLGKALLLLLTLLLAYLALAAAWAGASTSQLLVRQPSVLHMPLSPRQLEILLRIEDPTFFSHHGLSLADGQGVATISSAVARELLLYLGEGGLARSTVYRVSPTWRLIWEQTL